MLKQDKLTQLKKMVEDQFKLKQPLFQFDVESITEKNTSEAIKNLEAESIFIFAGWTMYESYIQLMTEMAAAFGDVPQSSTERWSKWDFVKAKVKPVPHFQARMKRVLEYASLLSSRS